MHLNFIPSLEMYVLPVRIKMILLKKKGYVMQIVAFTSSSFVFIFFLVCNKHNIKSHG